MVVKVEHGRQSGTRSTSVTQLRLLVATNDFHDFNVDTCDSLASELRSGDLDARVNAA